MKKCRTSHAVGILSVTMVVLGVVAGCQVAGKQPSREDRADGSPGTSSAAEEGPWAAELAQARARATTDFERQVLADGRITEAEFLEALDLRTRCYTEHGHPARVEPMGYGQYGFEYLADGLDDAGTAALRDTCDTGTVLVIEPLYYAMLVNPGNEDFTTLIVACLVGAELVPTGYSSAAYDADVSAGTLPYPPEDPRAVQCERDPTGQFSEPDAVAPTRP